MQSKYLTFDYFSKCISDPMTEVYDVLDNVNHPEYEKLKSDLISIDKIDLEKHVVENNVDFFIDEREEDKDLERRIFYLAYMLRNDIARMRIMKLLDINDKPSPYNSSNLKGLIIDKNNLASVNQFNIDNYGFEKRNLVYTLCPILGQSNSSYWLFHAILKYTREKDINFRVRLDPFIEIPLIDYRPMFYKMLVHGKPLDWKRLSTLRNDEFGQWFDEKEYNRIGFTDYVWSPRDKKIHFTCEELPKSTFKGIKTSRYFHAIFNKETGGIGHCDGAIRVYSDDELNDRANYHVKDAKVRKAGKRIKIFQYESSENQNKEIDQDIFCHLAKAFFVWNDDVQFYFI